MLAIITCHFLQAYNNNWAWILNIGVQVFFVLSGYLYGHKDINNWRKWFFYRFIKLYVPLYIYTTISLTLICLFSNTQVNITNYIKAGGVDGLNHLWFMKAIGLCYLTTPLLHLLKKYSDYCLMLLIIIGVLEYTIIKRNVFIFSWFWLYSFGYFFVNSKKKIQQIIQLIISISIIYMTYKISWIDILDYNGIKNRSYHDILGLFICLNGIYFFSLLDIKRKPLLLNIIDKNSYYLYLTHHIFLLGPFSFTMLIPNMNICIPIIIVLILLSTSILAFISNKCITNLNNIIS